MKYNRATSLTVLIFIALMFLAECALQAQSTMATISGTVTDPQGAVVPSAVITAVSNETGLKKSGKTDSDGRYTLLFLSPGLYDITAEATGFAPGTHNRVRLEVAQSATLDFSLALAAAQQTIQVQGEAIPLLNAESGGVGNTLENKLIQDLPSAERSTLALINNMAGIVDSGFALAMGESLNTNGNASGPIGSPGNRNYSDSNFSVNGSQYATNDVLLDGVSNTVADFNAIAISPPQDSVQEMKVLGGVLSAEYGRSGGGVVTFVTKGGGRTLHGTGYEYFQNGGLNANGWQRNRAGYAADGITPALPRIPIKRNQFGGSLGGPVVLPYFGRSQKTFFFFNYEGRRERNPYSKILTMPTAKMRTGDLSELLQPIVRNNVPLNADGSAPLYGQVYDPFWPLVRNPSGTMVRNTIPGNRLDVLPKCNSGPRQAACLDPVGLAFMKYLPLPNQPGLTDNYLYSGTSNFTRDMLATRIDRTLSERHSLFGRFSYEKRLVNEPDFLQSVASYAQLMRDIFFNVTLNDVYTLQPNIINNFRYGLTRANPHRIPLGEAANFDPSTLGLPSYIRGFASRAAFPVFNFAGGPQGQGLAGEITSSQIGGGGILAPRDTQTLANTVTFVRGGHTIKTGVEYRLMRYFYYKNDYPTGSFLFTRTFTRGPVPTTSPTVAPETGSSLASLFLGLPGSGTYRTALPTSLYQHYGATFVQDDWRLRRNLTINLGLRWDVETGTAESHGQVTNFDLQAKSHLNGLVPAPADPSVRALRPNFTDLRGLLSFPDGPQTRTNFNRFAPRIGFAYRLKDKTVIRGGYGMVFVPQSLEGDSALGVTFDTAVPQSSDSSGQVIQPGGTAAPTVFSTDPFRGILTPPPGRSLGPNTLIGESPQLVDLNRRTTYAQLYNLIVERLLPGNMVIDVAYVGSHGVRLPFVGLNINQIPPAFLDYARQNYASARDANSVAAQNVSQFFSQQVLNPFYGVITNAKSTVSSRTVRRDQLLKSYPEYDNPRLFRPIVGASKYNSLQVSLRKSYSNGLSALASYTFSKLIDLGGSGNSQGGYGGGTVDDIYNIAGDYTVSNLDVPHRLTASFSYELPFGRGKRFGRQVGALTNKLLGGLQFSGSAIWQSGTPVTVTAPGFGLSYAVRRPDRVAGVSASIAGDQMRDNIRRGGFAFDPNAYAQPADFTLGNAARNSSDTRRDTYKNLNLSLLKNFTFADGRHKVQLRGEFLNAFNMVVFGTPGTDVSNRDVVQNGVVMRRGTFARVTTQGNTPRIIQLVLRYSF